MAACSKRRGPLNSSIPTFLAIFLMIAAAINGVEELGIKGVGGGGLPGGGVLRNLIHPWCT